MTNKIHLHLLKFFFEALLVPKEAWSQQSPKKASYYSTLDIPTDATPDRIRRAYRKKSLQCHPDKVAQRLRRQQRVQERNDNDDIPQEEDPIENSFVNIKEAYETLSDPLKRNAYDVLGAEGGKMYCSVMGLDNSPDSGLGFEMNTMIFNLANASLFQKGKLFSLVFIVVMLMLLCPLLICAKIDSDAQNFDWEVAWIVLLTPLWIINMFILTYLLLGRNWFSLLRMGCIVALEVLLALKWDQSEAISTTIADLTYEFILIPLFIHQALILLEGIFLVLTTRLDIDRMVTVSYLERHVLPHLNHDGVNDGSPALSTRSYDDITDEERETIHKLYIIVTEIQNPDVDPFEGDDEDESLDSNQANLKFMHTVSSSPEYQYATRMRSLAIQRIISILIFRLPFLILLVLQLIDTVGGEGLRWNWNVVFVPIWVEVLLYTVSACFGACCAGNIVKKKGEGGDNDEMEIIEVVGSDEATEIQNLPNTEDPSKISTFNQSFKETEGQESQNLLTKANIELKGNVSAKTSTLENDYDSTIRPKINEHTLPSEIRREIDNDDVNVCGDGDDIEMDIDSQSAEEHVKALGGCCYYLMLVVSLTLFLVKLNRATSVESGLNFSSFWVIFPLFLIAALVLCLFGCCIFVTSESTLKQGEEENRNDGDVEQEENRNDGDVEDGNRTQRSSKEEMPSGCTGVQRTHFDDDPGTDEERTGEIVEEHQGVDNVLNDLD